MYLYIYTMLMIIIVAPISHQILLCQLLMIIENCSFRGFNATQREC